MMCRARLICRFPARESRWRTWSPEDASIGAVPVQDAKWPLSGNRQINRALHIMATVQLRNPGVGRDYYDRKKAAGKTSIEAGACTPTATGSATSRSRWTSARHERGAATLGHLVPGGLAHRAAVEHAGAAG